MHTRLHTASSSAALREKLLLTMLLLPGVAQCPELFLCDDNQRDCTSGIIIIDAACFAAPPPPTHLAPAAAACNSGTSAFASSASSLLYGCTSSTPSEESPHRRGRVRVYRNRISVHIDYSLPLPVLEIRPSNVRAPPPTVPNFCCFAQCLLRFVPLSPRRASSHPPTHWAHTQAANSPVRRGLLVFFD
jgi:hypothetical protein